MKKAVLVILSDRLICRAIYKANYDTLENILNGSSKNPTPIVYYYRERVEIFITPDLYTKTQELTDLYAQAPTLTREPLTLTDEEIDALTKIPQLHEENTPRQEIEEFLYQ